MPHKDSKDRKESQKRYVERHPERIKRAKDKYVLNNPVKRKESVLKHYRKHKDKYDDYARQRHRDLKKNRRSIQTWLEDRFKLIPCMDCNKMWPFCSMDFDHRPDEVKSFCVSKMNLRVINASNIAMTMKEVDKCDYVCASCHRIRTWERNHS